MGGCGCDVRMRGGVWDGFGCDVRDVIMLTLFVGSFQ